MIASPSLFSRTKPRWAFFLFLFLYFFSLSARASLIFLTVPTCKNNSPTASFSCTHAGGIEEKQLGDSGNLTSPGLA